ncbi:MAG TPA: type VI secretion system tip protein TssI/VgrG [Candidatus Dormibacteraeota bacterium]|nr:type VI secretion system tip protein TssI/VgrG [Candidatus Dormibacteraeota bacterium]
MPDESYSQDHRLLAIDTPLGKDVLLLQELTGYEGISRLFNYDLNLLAYDNDSISFEDIVGQKVSITMHLPDGTPRYISGFVSRFTQGETDSRLFTHYHAQVVPWLWFLTRQADCRIFQNLAVPDIISKIFDPFGFKDFRLSLKSSYPQLEYCVQYRETSFNFVSRLMEEFGIFYYFDHTTQGKHTLVLADQSSSLVTCPSSPVSYDTEVGGLDDPEVINNWHVGQEVKTGKYTVTDYNFTTPSTSLLANDPTVVSLSASQDLELFDYPGLHTTKDQGDTVAKVRMQEEEAGYMVVSGAGNCRGLMSGYSFELQNHYRSDQNTNYVVTEVRHFGSAGQSYTTAGTSGGETYSNHLTCIPASVTFRPARITPKPFVQGPQPAMVVGKSGEEIWVDKYGRVIVQFYWDRLGQKNENSSCWIRTSQPWAGGNWGAMWIPRIGQEVLVSFLEGDPDRPIITGRVYNADQMPPYTLPDYQTRSTFMSRSSKGGGSSNYNELRFEDLKGQEQIFMNAEKDMDLRVENDSREFIGANRHLIVTANQQEKINADKHLQVVGNHLEKITGNMSMQVTGNQMESVTGNKSLSVTGNQSESVTGNVSLSVTQGKNESITMGYAMSAMTIHLSAEMGIVIECPLGITLSSGANSIDIGPAGVFITGTPFAFINSGSSPASTNDPSAGSPDSPQDPKDPDTADDGSKGTKL